MVLTVWSVNVQSHYRGYSLLVTTVRILSCKNVGLLNIVKELFPPFVHTAWEELKYRNVWQLRSLAKRNFQETRLPRCSLSKSNTKRAGSLKYIGEITILTVY